MLECMYLQGLLNKMSAIGDSDNNRFPSQSDLCDDDVVERSINAALSSKRHYEFLVSHRFSASCREEGGSGGESFRQATHP